MRGLVALMLIVAGAGAGASAWRAIASLTGGAWGSALTPAWRRMGWLLLPGALLALVTWLVGAPPGAAWLGVRAALVFLAWAACASFAERAPAPALILWLCAGTVLATDWVAAPRSGWHSSMLGMTYATGQLAVAFALAVVAGRRTHAPARDVAGLIIVLALGWAYLAGVDYLTAWVADLPGETRWYLPRTEGTWAAVIVAAAVLHVIVPVGVLLLASLRTRHATQRVAAAALLLGEACHLAWMVLP